LMATALPVAFHIVYINFAIITLHVICDDVENKFFFFFFFFFRSILVYVEEKSTVKAFRYHLT